MMKHCSYCELTSFCMAACLAMLGLSLVLGESIAMAAPDPSDYYNGLYETGVNDQHQKLSENQPDPHWKIVGIFNSGGATCQRIQNGWGRSESVTGRLYSPWRGGVNATTVVERNGGAGLYQGGNSLSGNLSNTGNQIGTTPWFVTSRNARWIGINKYAYHYSDTSCRDLSYDHNQVSKYNDIYVFESTFYINAATDVIDYDSIKMTMDTTMYVDNAIAMQINGSMQIPSGNINVDKKKGFLPLYVGNNSKGAATWQTPGFAKGTLPTHNLNISPSPFKQGKNTVRIYINSNYSHIGFMISKIGLTFDFNAKISLDTRIRENGGAWNGDVIENVRPGAKLEWNHRAWQNGLGNTKYPITFYTEHDGGSQGTFERQIGGWNSNKGVTNGWVSLATEGTGSNGSKYYVRQSDVGGELCARTRSSRTSNLNANPLWSYFVCARIPYHYPSCDPNRSDCDNNPPKDCKWHGTCPNEKVVNYGVVPAVSYVGNGSAMMGETVSFRYSIANNSSFTKTKNMNYKAYIFVVKGGESLADADGARSYASQTAICRNNNAISARSVNSDQIRQNVPCVTLLNGSVSVNAGDSWSAGERSVVLNSAYMAIQPGDSVCSYITVDNWDAINNESAPSTVASNISCIRIGRRPQLQINGADSYASLGFSGSDFSSSSAIAGGVNHGSYSQYGLLTGSGTISNFGSAGYTVPGNNGMACRLAIANNASFVSNCTLVGRGGINKPLSTPVMPSETINFNDNSTTIQEIINSAGSVASVPGQYSFRFTGSGVLTINESTIPAGYDIQIFADHGVNINGNVVLGGTNTVTTPGGHTGNNGNHNGNVNGNGNNGNNQHANQGNNGNVGHDTPGSSTTVVDAGETKTYANLTQVPNLTVVARNGNINISSNVNYITGTYVAAKGSFNSCYDMDNLGIVSNCNNKLKINGAVVSKNAPRLFRTFGSGNSSGVDQWNGDTITSSSEWFNYTPNLWLSKYSSGSDTIDDFTTTSMNILPTRY